MFAVCGEALMDVYPKGATATGMVLDARIGGSPFNVAVGLARMQQPVCFVSAVSMDFLGERLMRALQEEGIDSSGVCRTDAPTTLSMVGLDGHGAPSYAFHGAQGADRQLRLGDIRKLPDAVQALHVGSYSMVVEPVGGTLRALVEQSKGRRFISYDPNVRPNVEPDLEVWRRHLDWMLARTDLLKVSEEDLALLAPGVPLRDFACAAHAQGVCLVVVTRGGEGSVAFSREAGASVQPVATQVIDTVGAGDGFQSALLTWLAERQLLDGAALARLPAQCLREALQFAGAAAAIVCGRRGADLARRSELVV